jgi:hypothetical protein
MPCPAAAELEAYAAGLTDPLEKQPHPSSDGIARAVFLIQRRYFQLREKAAAAHHKQSTRGHICLHQVFEANHHRLMALWEHDQEYRLTKPPRPAPPPPPPATEPPRPRSVAEALADVFGT